MTRKTVVLHSTWVNFYRLRPAFSDGSCDCDLSCVALTLTGELATFLALAGQFSLLRRWLSLLLYVAADDDGSTDGSPSAVHQPRCAHAFAALVDVLSAVHTSNVGPHGDVDFGVAFEVKARASALIAATPPAGSSRAAEEIQSLFGDAAFRSLVASAPEKSSPADLLSAAEHCRPQARFVFDSFARISHLADSLEALKRVLLVLPRELSSEIVLDACYALIDGVAATAEAIESAAGQSVESQPFSRQLSSHTSTAWRQAYEAALEGCALDDAVSALQRGVALLRSDDEQGMRPGGAQGTRLAEQQLVSALAARACAEGKAGWLLSLPLLLADPDGEGGAVNLTALLASEMGRIPPHHTTYPTFLLHYAVHSMAIARRAIGYCERRLDFLARSVGSPLRQPLQKPRALFEPLRGAAGAAAAASGLQGGCESRYGAVHQVTGRRSR